MNHLEEKDTQKFVQDKIYHYYYSHPPAIPFIEKREFGFGTWEEKIAYRHLWFKTNSELVARLLNDRPLFVSYSAAIYEFPDARPMTKKNWLGADLVFDLDAKHSEWDKEKKSLDCGKFTCQQCFDYIKEQTQRLIDEFLIPDFGFSKSEISLNFSGNRGYHVRISNEDVMPLTREERREIVDYLLANGITFNDFFSSDGSKLLGPTPNQGGYFGKVAKSAILLSQNPAIATSISRKLRDKANLEHFISGVQEGNWNKVGIPNKEKKFQRLFQKIISQLSVNVDSGVSIDTSKLLRMPDSINGSSGLIAKRISDLKSFEPTRDAVAFSSQPIKIRVIEPVRELSFLNSTFGPFEPNSEQTVPESLAIYLILKRAAILSNPI
ncbi:MAG: DNA primase catalytic subunit PriS [Candidatus Anstonellales archaeon]